MKNSLSILYPFKSLFALLCAMFLVFLPFACQKESPEQIVSNTEGIRIAESETGAFAVLLPESVSSGAEDRDNGQTAKKYPYYDGVCRLMFRVYSYTPWLPHGGNNPPCPNTDIVLEGYSKPNGNGTLLFSTTLTVNGLWQQIILPGSAYIRFKFLQNSKAGEGEDCRFKLIIAEHGWNKGLIEWYDVPYGYWNPILSTRFAPKDPSTNGDPNWYDEYLCEPWCTWSADVSFSSEEPWPWISAVLRVFHGTNTVFPVFYSDPRLIRDIYIYETVPQSFLVYPMAMEAGEHYRSGMFDIGPGDQEFTPTHEIFDANLQGSGPFTGWGQGATSPLTTDGACGMLPNR